MKIILFLTAVATTAVLINRYNSISWWVCAIASAIFLLVALFLSLPLIALYFLKDLTLQTVYAIKEEFK